MNSNSFNTILTFFKRYQLVILGGGVILSILWFFYEKLGASAIFITFLTSISLFFINKNHDEKQKKIITILFLLAFLLHIAAVFFIFYGRFQPFSDGRGDYVQYHFTAVEVAERLHRGNFSQEGLALAHYFPLIVGYLYFFLVPKMIIGQLLNAWLVALTVIFVYLLVKELGRTNKEAFLVGLIVTIYPSLAFFGSLMIKEAFVVFFSTVSLLLAVRLLHHFSWRIFALLYLVLMGLTHFRFFISVPLIFLFMVFWFLLSKLPRGDKMVYGLCMFLLFGFLPIISTIGGTNLGYFGLSEISRQFNFKNIIYYRDKAYAFKEGAKFENVIIIDDVSPLKEEGYIAESQNSNPESQDNPHIEVVKVSEILKQVPEGTPLPDLKSNKDWGQDSSINLKTGNNLFEFVKNSFVSFIYALFGPFPWQLRYAKHLFILPEIFFWWFCLVFIIKGAFSLRQNYKLLFPLLFGLMIVGIVSLYMTNFGLVTRLRMPALVVFLCLVPFGWGKIKHMRIPFLKFIEE